MSLFADFPEGVVETDAMLAPLTWFQLGGRADFLVRPQNDEQLSTVLHRCRESDVPVRVLGLGANILVPDDGVRGVVLRLDAPCFSSITIDRETLIAGGGADMTTIVKRCVREGLAGLEQLAGIPGTVGGGIAMNCGGKYGDISTAVSQVDAVRQNGERESLTRSDLGFSYRESKIGDRVVTRVQFALHTTDAAELRSRFRETWDYKHSTQPSFGALSVGCIFRNPNGDSAGRLIDSAGLKGYRIGSAFVSEQHANFAMADRGGNATDVRKLIDSVQNRVEDFCGIRLVPEVKLW
ncbi:MAG: UDP-N-acetylmuramate dehydrogenase [Phycisphaerales bacterium]|nr:UDP-N-acetylmuramate dehydrogenase [Phycisphaerales bacterium]MCB9858685.1 UDP-N-acetylmuramate dehydrogenase [Phycisphaerales bacterium]MCB9864459.1 UDP-N-acetylmuramate dehydrogenase [Phycisphaerales bacterium]